MKCRREIDTFSATKEHKRNAKEKDGSEKRNEYCEYRIVLYFNHGLHG
jgi:hypothetical protein